MSVANSRKDEGENICSVFLWVAVVPLPFLIRSFYISEEHFQARKDKEDFSLSDRRERLPSFDSFHYIVSLNAVCGGR